MLERQAATCRRLWTSPKLRAPPCPLRRPQPVPAGLLRGGGSRRSLLLPPWLVGRRGRSASPLARAPPWGARLAGCALPPLALALCALARLSLALGAAFSVVRRVPCSRPTPRRSCLPLCGG